MVCKIFYSCTYNMYSQIELECALSDPSWRACTSTGPIKCIGTYFKELELLHFIAKYVCSALNRCKLCDS